MQHEKQHGNKKGFPLHYYFILYNSSPREVRLGGQWQELMYRWRKAEYWLTLYGLLILNNYASDDISLGLASLTVN